MTEDYDPADDRFINNPNYEPEFDPEEDGPIMDPNAVVAGLLQALADDDAEAVADLLSGLRDWTADGNYQPDDIDGMDAAEWFEAVWEVTWK